MSNLCMQSRQLYQLLADLVLLLHFCIAAFIVLGLLLIFVGGLRQWRWIRNPWFRYAHLIGIGFIALQAWLGQLCPLTILENSLRSKAGDATYPGSFMAYWISELLYYELPIWVFALIYSVFAGLVIIAWVRFKPDPF